MRLPRHARSFTRRLLAWFRTHGRQLPWRATRDPYRILVSEIMLQQTQVPRVLQYYPRFLERYPTLFALAKAAPAQVREAWEGLGYYQRARNLHRLARTVVRDHGGRLPRDPQRLRTLPGVGPYTAAAVASFAYQRRTAPVDTNVARVLSRAFGLEPRPARLANRTGTTRAARRALWDLAQALLPRRAATAWEFNQALMDLGAMYCKARAPDCPHCPVRRACLRGRRVSEQPGSEQRQQRQHPRR